MKKAHILPILGATIVILASFSVAMASNLTPADPNFPYGSPPKGNVAVSKDEFATPESMLGSWAMLEAVTNDINQDQLPKMFKSNKDVVYGVGTAAIGPQLGVAHCAAGGCDQLNGYCFAARFNNKTTGPKYIIFQSVNIGANANSLDIYMAGGGAGAFPGVCTKFWGNNSANWSNNIENSPSCNAYFNNYSNVNSQYKVTYNSEPHDALTTLKNACTYAQTTGFDKKNFQNLSIVPVTCPANLTHIKLKPQTQQHIGSKKIIKLNTLTDADFSNGDAITNVSTTQMEDCKTPSSGYTNKPNEQNGEPNYRASISASLTKPLLTGNSSGGNHPVNPTAAGSCTWNGNPGGSWCNDAENNCKECAKNTKDKSIDIEWCTMKGDQKTCQKIQ
jgi:hypothetical protein